MFDAPASAIARVKSGMAGPSARSPTTDTACPGGWFSTAFRSASADARTERARSASACARARPTSAWSTSSRGAAPSSKRACATDFTRSARPTTSSARRDRSFGGQQPVEGLAQVAAQRGHLGAHVEVGERERLFGDRDALAALAPDLDRQAERQVLVRRVLRGLEPHLGIGPLAGRAQLGLADGALPARGLEPEVPRRGELERRAEGQRRGAGLRRLAGEDRPRARA